MLRLKGRTKNFYKLDPKLKELQKDLYQFVWNYTFVMQKAKSIKNGTPKTEKDMTEDVMEAVTTFNFMGTNPFLMVHCHYTFKQYLSV